MITRDPPFHWDVSCDNCSTGEERIEGDENEFMDVVAAIKELGWTIRRRDGEWEHLCPDCHKK